MTLAERLKQARQGAAMTQQVLAATLGVSQPTVNRWETGEAEPSRAQTEALADALGRSPAWLAFGTPETGKDGQAMFEDIADKRVAFQGLPGAYSHLACRTVLPDFEAIPCATFEDAFAAVRDGTAALGMIPIENSLGGRVADIHHLLPESGLYIVGEHFQPIHHCLLAPRGASLTTVKRVFSHTQALAQCRDTLRELKFEPVKVADTAGAAKAVAERGDVSEAAIASDLAGEIYELETLRARIEDRIGNTTRFVIMSRQRKEPDPRAGPAMTSFTFQVRSVPAALYKALGGFATNGVNITKLESYITDASFRVAQFYAEIEGHPADRPVDFAMQELNYFTSTVKVLGVYPAHPFRRSG
jgi:prephenate dehydratase